MPRIGSDSSAISSWSEVLESPSSPSYSSNNPAASSNILTPSRSIIRIQPHSSDQRRTRKGSQQQQQLLPSDQHQIIPSTTRSCSNGSMNSIKSTGSSRHRSSSRGSSSRTRGTRKAEKQQQQQERRSRSASSSSRSRGGAPLSVTSSSSSQQEHHFQSQHDLMLSRQQFRTKTGRITTGMSGDSKNNTANTPQRQRPAQLQPTQPGGGNLKRGIGRSIPSMRSIDSYESGNYSHMSRRTDNDSTASRERQHTSRSHGFGSSNINDIDVNNASDTKEQQQEQQQQQQQSKGNSSAKRVIQELNKAIGHERRITAITNACAEFDHWDTEKHNVELQLGGANTLSLVLSMTDEEDEIRMICAALEMVYRASTEMVRKSFHDVGPAVMPILLKLLGRCEDASLKHADVSIMNITKVLLYLSRVSELRAPLARHPGMLSAMTRVATAVLNPDARVLRMRVIANLANEEQNKLLIMEHESLLDSVLKIAALDLSESAREYASAAIMDIASSSNTQMKMAQNDKLLATLVKLSVKDERMETREYAVTALQNLAFSKENRLRLVTYSNGVVLEALKKGLSVDPNDKTRRRAAGALTNLGCDETADIMGAHHALIDTLSRVTTQDQNHDVQKRACLALTKIASSCSSRTDLFETVMEALVQAASSPNSTGIPAVFRVQARDASRRTTLARLPGILETLAEMSTASSYNAKDKDNAMRAIMHLTNENENRKILCNRVILNALVQASNLDGEHSETRDSAIVAIERLATEVSNRQYMARHDGLLVAIAKATERESKSELAGEKTSQPRLAKQLLMSLLLAM